MTKANFHFSHNKSMATLSFHSNQSISATAITPFLQRLIFLTFLQSFSFIPLMASEEIYGYFFRKFSILVAMATNTIQRFGQR